jgi:hypothetical protein
MCCVWFVINDLINIYFNRICSAKRLKFWETSLEIPSAESEDDDPNYAPSVGLQVVLDSVVVLRMCMENMFEAQDTRHIMM